MEPIPTVLRPTGLRLGAVVGGVLCAAVVQVLLMTLGAAVGLTAFTLADTQQPEIQLGYAAWLVGSLLASMFIGAMVAAAGARSPLRRDGLLHGLVTWAAVGLLGFFLVSRNANDFLGGALRLAGHSAEAAAPSPEAANVVREEQERATAQVQGEVSQTIDQVKQVVSDVGTKMEASQAADSARQGIAISLWGFLGVEMLLLLAALAGGALGAGSKRRRLRDHGVVVHRSDQRPAVSGQLIADR